MSTNRSQSKFFKKNLAALMFCTIAGTGLAQSDAQPDLADGAYRIAAASKMPMLIYRASGSACAVRFDADSGIESAAYENATAEFATNMRALRNGDEALQINGGETSAGISAFLKSIQGDFKILEAAMETLASPDQAPAPYINYMVSNYTTRISVLTDILSVNIGGKYRNSAETTEADALLLTFAMRQNMFTQQLKLLACGSWSDVRRERSIAEIESIIDVFEKTNKALRNGMPAFSIQPAPTPEIEGILDAISSDWVALKIGLNETVATQDVSAETKLLVRTGLEDQFTKTQQLVELYQAYLD